ncbi:ADP-ribosylation factor-like protein [Bacteroides sp. GM023]|uniref:ADP-ribosylation factor-like protein n=1 Tax=Bacteroides sp. GM023 TaxID=2723058 RepID=UPI00168BB683|nr:ADP-ribosylation factor-like protein [Bacteroides sp. GM023]MBD3592309.1 hypothetical protein [Bacteroides sp. GM023]
MLGKDEIINIARFFGFPYFDLFYFLWKKYIENLLNTQKRIGISIIGMSESGKTYLYDKIREEDRCKEGTTAFSEKLKAKIIKIEDKEIELQPTIDISGDSKGMEYFEELYENCDIMIVTFDIYKFLSNEDYRRDFAQRIKAVLTRKEKKKRKIILLGSHLDQIEKTKENQVRKKILEYALNEKYIALQEYIKSMNPLVLGNLTNDDWIKEFKRKYLFLDLLKQ